MITIIPAEKRFAADEGWLKSHFLFSFAQYHDPKNEEFGNLRVFNDDVVMAKKGFGMHPHAEMEIVTIVLDGAISHKDSLGNAAAIRPGEIQRMTAGTGITHSEWNNGDIPVHLYQLWFYPNKSRLKPGYDQKSVDWKKDALTLAASNKSGSIQLHADVALYLGHLSKGKELTHKGKKTFVYVTKGELVVNGKKVGMEFQARIQNEETILQGTKESRFVLIECE